VSARLPAAFEPAIKTVIADCIATIHNKATATSVVITTNCIEADPTAGSCFALTGQVV